MTLPIQLAESRLLLPAGLDAGGLERTFGTLLGPGVDFGDLYFQHARRESWTVEDGIVKDGAHSIEQGVGVRAISGEKTGFAYSDDINTQALAGRVEVARARSPATASTQSAHALVRGGGRELYAPRRSDRRLRQRGQGRSAARVDRLLRAADPRVQQVMVSLSGGVDTDPGRAQRRRARRRRAPAGALQRAGDRRTERPPRERLRRWRRALQLRRTARRTTSPRSSRAKPCARRW